MINKANTKRGVVLLMFFISMILLIGFVSAEKLEIQIMNSDAENVNFKAILYDDNNNKINGEVSYIIKDYYGDIQGEGKTNSGEEVNFKLPKNPYQGPWEISINYNNVEAKELFNVGKLEKAEIKLEGDNLVIENIGNVPYDRNILIYIGDNHETARVYLEVEQTKRIRLTAPTGEYTIKVDDGSAENKLVFNGVSLTGNVVGLDKVLEGGFWERYPLVSLFLGVLVVLIIIIFGLKFYNQYFKKDIKSRTSKKKK